MSCGYNQSAQEIIILTEHEFFSRHSHCTRLHKNYLTIFAQNADGNNLKISVWKD